MNSNYLLYSILGLVGLCSISCTSEDISPSTDKDADKIYLSARVDSKHSTRMPFDPIDGSGNSLYAPTTTQPLNVSVWASTNSGVFPNEGKNGSDGSDGTVAIHTKAHFQSGAPQLLGEAIYPKDESTYVYFVGLHPKSVDGGNSWTASDDNRAASYTFTGKDDVMFAPQIYGTYGIAYESSPQFYFHHLLTWLNVEIVADKDEADVEKREAVSAAWGQIKRLTIVSKNQVTICNLNEATDTDYATHVAFEGNEDQELSFFYNNTDKPFPDEGYTIPTTKSVAAYVMCAPVQAEYQHTVDGQDVLKPEYTLRLETEKRTLDIPVDLRKSDLDTNNDGEVSDEERKNAYFTGSTMGKQFTLLLNFKMGNVISVSATISLEGNSDWFTHGTGSNDVEEEDIDE